MLIINSDLYKSNTFLSKKEISLKLEELKKQGKKIGLCTGSFDLLHPGHITHLVSAKKLCDVLIVAIAEDDYTKKTRGGEGRPIFSHDIRAFMVGNLKAVDYVILDTWLPEPGVLEFIKPDVFIKGLDYSDEKDPRIIHQKKIVESIGAIIVYTKDEKLSTTDILKHIKEKIG